MKKKDKDKKSNEIVRSPHDQFFKTAFEDKEKAKELLRQYLPQKVLDLAQLDTLKICSPEFTRKKELTSLYSDMLYNFKLADTEAYVYTIVEHQSQPCAKLPFRIHRYALEVMERHFDEHKCVAPVFSLCLYHGKKSPYPHATNLLDLFEDRNLGDYSLREPVRLIDLTVEEDSKILQDKKLSLTKLILKHIFDKNIHDLLKDLLEKGVLREIILNDHPDFVTSSVAYVLSTTEKSTFTIEEVVDTFKKADPALEEGIMTIAEDLIQKGEKKGIEKGRKEGILFGEKEGMVKTYLNLIGSGIPISQLSKMLNMSPGDLRVLINDYKKRHKLD